MDTKQSFELDLEQKEAAIAFRKNLASTIGVGKYMCEAIKTANIAAGLSDKDFWRRLFIQEGTGDNNDRPLLRPGRIDGSPNRCPADPYKALDVQACSKYLRFGGDRIISSQGGRIQYAEDSYNFFSYFHLPYEKKRGPKHQNSGPQGSYRNALDQALEVRNIASHDRIEDVEKITLTDLSKDINRLKDLTAPLMRRHDWPQSDNLRKFWKEQEKLFQKEFGAAPIDLDLLAHEIFTTEEPLTTEQQQAIDHAVERYNLKVRDGLVYREPDSSALKSKLCDDPMVAALLGRSGATVEDAVARAEAATRQREEAELVVPELPAEPLPSAPSAAAGVLTRAGVMPAANNAVLSSILDAFILMVDESIFLYQEGRSLLMELSPLLSKRQERLHVDESVVTSIFNLFRSSVPYTPLELADMDPEEAESIQKNRAVQHRSAKAAIKALSYLRKRGCLEVVFRPTTSRYSYDNIRWVVEHHLQSRFLILTMDRQLAEELGALPRGNAAAAKPGLDGQLLVFRATQRAYRNMLRQETPSNVPADPVAITSKQRTSMPVVGDTVLIQFPGGEQRELRLGQPIGQGGEGVVYASGIGGAVKLYHPNHLTQSRQEKLLYMTGADPQIPGLCWPQAMIYNTAGEWVGFLMPRAKGDKLSLSVFHPGRNGINLVKRGWNRRNLALIAANIAAIFAKMHAAQILMGDVNPHNFLVAPDCSVSFVDCDSYQAGTFSCPVGMAVYTPPEVHRRMREAGREDYGYMRTIDNELYSLAVLLFEILMLGKPPYESRNSNVEDVVQAIISGSFPYPFRTDEDDEDAARRGLLAPVGRWRQIWSHTTYTIKEAFYNVFSGKGRLSAAEWESVLREYARQIELGHSSNELLPSGYKVVSSKEGESSTSMVDLVCDVCGCQFNMSEDVYQRRLARREPIRCNTHWEIYQNFRRRKKQFFCQSCNAPFEVSVARWMDRTKQGKSLLCPDCLAKRRNR